MGFVKRSTRNITSQSARRTLYLKLVRPQLGYAYATQVWSAQSVELISQLERTGMDPAGSGRGGVHQSRVGVDQRYKYMGLGVDHGAGHDRPCDQTSNVQRSAA